MKINLRRFFLVWLLGISLLALIATYYRTEILRRSSQAYAVGVKHYVDSEHVEFLAGPVPWPITDPDDSIVVDPHSSLTVVACVTIRGGLTEDEAQRFASYTSGYRNVSWWLWLRDLDAADMKLLMRYYPHAAATTCVDAQGCPIDAEFWSCVGAFPRLRECSAVYCDVASGDLRSFTGHRELRKFHYLANRSASLDVEPLASCPKLRELIVRPDPSAPHPIASTSLASFSQAPMLRRLGVDGPQWTDDSLLAIESGFPSLERLSFQGSRITVEGIERLHRARPKLSVYAIETHSQSVLEAFD